MNSNEILKEIEFEFDWCLDNEKECLDTKYEEDSIRDNWFRLRNKLSTIFEKGE